MADADTVADRELRHLESAYALMSDAAIAHRFLAALPWEVRTVAEESAARTWQYGGEAVAEIVQELAWERSR